jgi:hypothetical protein
MVIPIEANAPPAAAVCLPDCLRQLNRQAGKPLALAADGLLGAVNIQIYFKF